MDLDVSELTASLSNWEMAGYVSVAAVAIGVAGEAIHEFTDCFKSVRWWKENGSKASALLLIVALAAELVIQIKANSISGRIIALLNDETERLTAANLNLEKEIAPRDLSPDVRTRIGKSIEGFSGHQITVRSYALDLEAARLGKEIIEALHHGRLTVFPNLASDMPFGGFSTGIEITGPEDDRELIKLLARGLIEEGDLKSVKYPPFDNEYSPAGGTLDVMVGLKPISD